MPAETGLTKFSARGAETMTKESEDWAVALRAFVESYFKNVGVGVESAANPLSSGASDEEISQVIQQLQQKYNSISTVLYKKPKDIAKDAYTLTDQVAMLPCAANSDAVVFIRGAGGIPTDGRNALAMMGGMVLTPNAIVTITLADAKSGEILAMMRFHNADDDFLGDEEAAFSMPLIREFANVNIGTARKLESAREFGP